MTPHLSENVSPQPADLARMESIFARQQEAYAKSPMLTLEERRRHLLMLRALLL